MVYQPTTDSTSIDFDAVSTLLRGIDKKDIRRGMVVAKPGSYATVRAIVNDYVGNVTEYLFDSRQRCLSKREFTGRANPTLPTTATENRPKGKLRIEDPEFFETRWEWNADSLCTLEIRPNGDSTEISHQRAQDHNSSRSNKTASRRHDGDVRVLRERAGSVVDTDGDGAPDTSELAWHFEYDPRFGSPAVCEGKKLYVGNLPFSATDTARKGWDGTIKGAWVDSAKIITDRDTGRSKGFGARIVPDRDTGRSKGFGFVTQEIDARGNYTISQFDNSGNCTRSIKQGHYAVSNFKIEIDAAHNSHGQITIITNAPDANGYRRVDTIGYYETGPQRSMVEVMIASAMAGGLSLTTAFVHDDRGNLTQVTDARGNTTLFAYNALDQCVQSQTAEYGGGGGLPAQRVTTQYRYDANDNLARCDLENRDETAALNVSNPLWTTLFEYDNRDRLEAVVREVSHGLPGRCITNQFVYDSNDNVVLARSPLAVSGADPNNTLAFEYDERGLLFREIAAPGGPRQSTAQCDYDGNGNLTRISEGLEAEPSVTQIEYEKLRYVGGGGKAQGIMGAKAKAWMVNNYEVHPVFGLRPARKTWNKECIDKDTTIRPSQITDPMGNVTAFHYDANGNLKVARHFGETNDVPGNAGNVLLAETRFVYDSFDRCIQRTDSFFDVLTGAPIGDGKAATVFSYAPNGACVSAADDNGHTTLFGYDTAGRLASVTDPRGNVVQYTYDECDNIVSKISNERSELGQGAQQFGIAHTYDALNRCLTTADNVGNTDRYAYDSRGNVVSHLDPRGNEAVSVFDGLNRCVAQTNYAGNERSITINTSHIEYNDNSRISAFTDSNGNTTTYAYDECNRCVLVAEADGTSCSLVWSPRSNLMRVEDANGTTMTNKHDLRNRIVHRDIAARGGALSTTTFEMFAYDGFSRCVAASNDVSLATFAYDSLGHCVRTSQDGLESSATFDGADNRLSLTYPSGRIVAFGYNALDQLASVSSSAGGGLPSVTLATYAYDGPGRLGRVLRSNNVATRYQWNGLVSPPNVAEDFGWQQVSGINHQVAGGGAVVDRRVSAFDPAQNRVLRAQTAPFYPGGPSRTNQFAYDALDRLSGNMDSILGLIRVYELDGNGNRLAVSSNGVPESYTMDSTFPDPADYQMNQYTVTPFGSQTYDANGNLLSRQTPDGPIHYQYDYANRLVLVGVLGAEGTLQPLATFAYDALGRRIGKTIYPPVPLAPETIQYVHGGGDCDDAAEEILEMRSGGVVLATHVGGGAAAASYAATGRSAPPLVTFNGAGQPMFLHADDMGSVLALTDAAGSVLERYDYDEFGHPSFLTPDGVPSSSSESIFGNVFLFHGMEWDGLTGLYYDREGQGSRQSNPLYESSGHSGENPLFEGKHLDCKTATSIGLPKITPKIARESHGRRFAGNNAWSPKSRKGIVKFFNESKGFGRSGGGGGSGGIVVVLDGLNGTARLIVPVAMDKGLRLAAREEGGRHTPFHNKYRAAFRKILDYGEAGDNINVSDKKCLCRRCTGSSGHVTVLK